MTKEQIKLVLNIIRPAIRALSGYQNIKMTGYDNVVIENGKVEQGKFYIMIVGRIISFEAYIYKSKIESLREV